MIKLRTHFAPQLIDPKAAVQSIGAPLASKLVIKEFLESAEIDGENSSSAS